jgi:hypothetical protein
MMEKLFELLWTALGRLIFSKIKQRLKSNRAPPDTARLANRRRSFIQRRNPVSTTHNLICPTDPAHTNPDGATFCNICGAKLETPVQVLTVPPPHDPTGMTLQERETLAQNTSLIHKMEEDMGRLYRRLQIRVSTDGKPNMDDLNRLGALMNILKDVPPQKLKEVMEAHGAVPTKKGFNLFTWLKEH